MEDRRKRAYRYLLYAATLDTRPIEWFWYRGIARLVPFVSRRKVRAVKRAGALADWLHNLALYSALDFEGFDEAWFWRDHDSICSRNPDLAIEGYRRLFETWTQLAAHEGPGSEMWGALWNVRGD
jgi:hypothetical protein